MNPRPASIWGVGTSQFGRHTARLPAELAWEAITEALADAETDTVDAAFVGTVFGATGVAQRALTGVGLTEIPIVTVENACASGTTAFHEARQAVLDGRYERVLVLGVEHLTSRFQGPIVPEATDAEQSAGMLLPALYGMVASRYLATGRATISDMARIAVKNSRHGALNPRAQRRRELTEDEVLASRPIAEPLTQYQCAGLSDAAAAAVVGPQRHARDVPILASVLRTGRAWGSHSASTWTYDLVEETAHDAYAEAGLSIEDVDLAEVHDAFTIGEIAVLEALGAIPPGGIGPALDGGELAIGGRLPVNPSGGLLSRGHPLGATGVAQIAEVVMQIRGEAGSRQVAGARRGLVETAGGGASGIDGNACVVAMFGEA